MPLPLQVDNILIFIRQVVALFQHNNIFVCIRQVAAFPACCDVSNKLTLDLLTLKVVPESRVMWATSVPILVFLGLSILNLGPMYATDSRFEVLDSHHVTHLAKNHVRQKHRLMSPPTRGRGIIVGCILMNF